MLSYVRVGMTLMGSISGYEGDIYRISNISRDRKMVSLVHIKSDTVIDSPIDFVVKNYTEVVEDNQMQRVKLKLDKVDSKTLKQIEKTIDDSLKTDSQRIEELEKKLDQQTQMIKDIKGLLKQQKEYTDLSIATLRHKLNKAGYTV